MPRRRLPQRRPSRLVNFRVGGLKYHATVSFFEDGLPAEVFLTVGKTGTEAHTLARDVGITTSLLLQYGCPVEELRSALTRSPDGSADGPLGILLDLLVEEPSNDVS